MRKHIAKELNQVAGLIAGERTAKVNAGLSHFNAPQANFQMKGSDGFSVNVSAIGKSHSVSAADMVADMKKFQSYMWKLSDEMKERVGVNYDGEVYLKGPVVYEVRVSGMSNKPLIYTDLIYRIKSHGLEFSRMDVLQVVSEAL